MKYFYSLTLLLCLFSTQALAEIRGYAFSGTIDTVAEDGSMDQFLGGTFRGQFTYDDETGPYYSDPTIARHLGAELSITYTDANGTDYFFNMRNATFAVLDNYVGLLDGFAVNNPDIQTAPPIIETDLPLPNSGQNLMYPVRIFSLEDVIDNTSPTQAITPDATYTLFDVAVYDQDQQEYYLNGPIESFIEFDITAPIEASNFNRGYTFTGTIDVVAEDGSMDQFLGGTYRGQFVFNDETVPYYSDPTIARHLSAELSITYTDIHGHDYSFHMQNATFAVLNNYVGLLDGFAVNNPDIQIVPPIIETDLPLPNSGQNLIYPVRIFSLEDVIDNTSPTQAITPDATYTLFDVAAYDQRQQAYYLNGPIDSFEEFYVPRPIDIGLTNSLNVGGQGYEGEFSYDSVTDAYSLTSGGTNIGGWVDWFHFVYEPMQGDVDIRAQVQYISGGWSSAGIMIRDELYTYSKYAANLITLYEGGVFSLRTEEYTPYPALPVPELAEGSWLRLTKQGDTITSYISSDGENWTVIASETLVLSDTFYIGLAGVAESLDNSTDIIIDNVTISQ